MYKVYLCMMVFLNQIVYLIMINMYYVYILDYLYMCLF